jgi:hypothetical protein
MQVPRLKFYMDVLRSPPSRRRLTNFSVWNIVLAGLRSAGGRNSNLLSLATDSRRQPLRERIGNSGVLGVIGHLVGEKSNGPSYIALGAATILLAACGGTTEERAATGGLGGAAAGALVGGPVGAVVGAAAGATGGAVMDEGVDGDRILGAAPLLSDCRC